VEFSIKLKLIDKSVLQEVKNHYKAVGLEFYLDLSLEVKKEILKIMSLDKKNSKSTFTKLSQDLEVRSEINLVLLKKLGKAINKIVKTEDIYNYLINDYNNNTVF
jgi:3-dehydroquinate synthetase